MSDTPPSLSDFRPVVGDEATPARKKFRVSRSVVIIAVVGVHVIAGAWFALPRVMKAVEGNRAEEKGPPLQLVDMEITTQQTEVAAKSRQPRLKNAPDAETPTQFAQRAGVRVDLPTQALLLVTVGADGKPRAIEIAESSGNPRLDDVAVQYARSQQWIPDESGEAASSVPFTVEFPAAGAAAPRG